MLKNIPKIISPQLLKYLSEMGHGDELVIADGNFPSKSIGQRVVRADGLGGVSVLKAIMQLFVLDTYSQQNVMFMEVVKGDPTVPTIWNEYKKVLLEVEKDNAKIGYFERFAFYERCKSAYVVVATGEGALYANIILKKGVVTQL